MDDRIPTEEDGVYVRRRTRSSRIELGVEDFADERDGTTSSPEANSAQDVQVPAQNSVGDVRRRGAAVLHGDRRLAIPESGLLLGRSSDADIRVERGDAAEVEASIEPTTDGHVIVARRDGVTFVNGERVIADERRPLERGDSISVAGEILYYLPAGAGMQRLAPIALIDAGRLRTRKPEYTIGRDPGCDLVLDHPTVSRTHAVIRIVDDTTIIEDRASATGLRVNGETVKRAQLVAGDQLAIGPFRVVFDGDELVDRVPTRGFPVVAEGIQVDVDAGTILQPLDLQLRPGEMVAVIGESGAGKTTLLKTLAGVSPATRGRILIGGEDAAERTSDIGYVPQFDIVHGALTVREALDYAARLRLPADTATSEREVRVAEIIATLGLEKRADVRVERLSGGQRKRVAVGVELLHRPGVLFLDEPTTGLDPALEHRMMELFRNLAEAGQTVVLTTHATASLTLCQRIVLMGAGGVLLFDGPPGELLATFDTDSFDAVYARLEEVGARLEQNRTIAVPGPATVTSAGRPRRPRPVRNDLEYQVQVLASRYATLFLRDRRHLKSAFIQIPILAVLTALLFNAQAFLRFDPAGPSRPLFTSQGAQIVFFMVTISVWLGSINAAREIVKERSVLSRELAVGVQLPAYIASKLVVLLTLSTVQTSLFAIVVLTLRPLHENAAVLVQLIAVLIIASWVAVLLGLVVSALARSEDQATGVIPILLVPELLFGGAIVPLAQMSGLMHVVAALVPARWSYAAAGNAIHLQQRINQDPVFAPISRFGQHFFSLPLQGYVLISMLFGACLCALLGALLQKPYAP